MGVLFYLHVNVTMINCSAPQHPCGDRRVLHKLKNYLHRIEEKQLQTHDFRFSLTQRFRQDRMGCM